MLAKKALTKAKPMVKQAATDAIVNRVTSGGNNNSSSSDTDRVNTSGY